MIYIEVLNNTLEYNVSYHLKSLVLVMWIREITENIQLSKVNNRKTRKICSKLTIETQEKDHCCQEYSKSAIEFPADIYLLKFNNRNTRTRCEICSKLAIKTPGKRQAWFWCLYC